MVLALEVRDAKGVIDQATSAEDTPAVVTLGEAQCGGSDKTTLEVVVRPVGGDRVAETYVLTRSGSF